MIIYISYVYIVGLSCIHLSGRT